MKLRQLEVFRAVVETGTTKGAAHLLNISQPAVSTLIQHTEDQLGFELFERVRGRLVPTEEALSLYAESSPIFLLFASIQRKVEDLRQGRHGSLRIAATPSLGNSVLPQAIHAFTAKRPGVRISVDIRDRETIFHHVARSVAEIGMVLEFRDHPNLTSIPLHRGQFVCAMRRDHPLANNEVIRISDLRGVKIVRLERGTVLGDLIDRAASSLGEPLNWSIETRYCATACAFVEKGEDIAIVDEYSTRGLLSPNIIIKPIFPAIPIAAFVIYASDRPLSKMAKLIIADIKMALKNNL
jgi:DNA-binding transcriptional LysR family regulator